MFWSPKLSSTRPWADGWPRFIVEIDADTWEGNEDNEDEGVSVTARKR